VAQVSAPPDDRHTALPGRPCTLWHLLNHHDVMMMMIKPATLRLRVTGRLPSASAALAAAAASAAVAAAVLPHPSDSGIATAFTMGVRSGSQWVHNGGLCSRYY
jgi:hypothetical protein